MTAFTISNLQDASILALNDMRDVIQIDPVYQRVGGVWSKNNKRLFIDSLINRYDVPKFYFHLLKDSYKHEKFEYSIIDGRQRLEAIWEFINGNFSLAEDFIYLEDPNIKVAGMTFAEMAKEYPRLATRFNSRSLSIMVVSADDIDFVEDMFSRLNEAVPLNAAEKRNAFGGPLPVIVRDLVKHRFFSERIPVSKTRYRHFDLAAKLLYLEENLLSSNEFVDTKKASLDAFFKNARGKSADEFNHVVSEVRLTIDIMAETFANGDELLRSVGIIPVYYCLFSMLRRENLLNALGRKALVTFEDERRSNREKFAQDQDGVEFKYIEYDELAQSSNDAASIRSRYDTLRSYLNV